MFIYKLSHRVFDEVWKKWVKVKKLPIGLFMQSTMHYYFDLWFTDVPKGLHPLDWKYRAMTAFVELLLMDDTHPGIKHDNVFERHR